MQYMAVYSSSHVSMTNQPLNHVFHRFSLPPPPTEGDIIDRKIQMTRKTILIMFSLSFLILEQGGGNLYSLILSLKQMTSER